MCLLHGVFYYASSNILFARNVTTEKMGTALAKLNAIPQTVGLAGPILGAVITTFFGFKTLFAITFIISIFSFLPLLFLPSLKTEYKFRPKKGFDFFRKHPKLIFSEIFDNIGGETDGVIWPIFIFLTIKNIVLIGALRTFISISSIFFTLIVGKLADKKDERVLMRIAVPLIIINWIIRFYFPSPMMIGATTIASGFLVTLLIIPYTRLTFNKAKKYSNNEEFYIIKEIPTVIGRLIIFSLALVFADNIQ